MTPYYQDDSVTIYHGDCREILPLLNTETVVVSDPPYGINYQPGSKWQQITGDAEPFDPAPLLTFAGTTLFGANHYANRLPNSAGWIIWNKRDRVSRGLPGSDVEMAWTNRLTQARLITHVWIPHTLRDEQTYHPTQKPTAVMRFVIAETTSVSEVVLDPYMGSGSTLRAAKDVGRRAIGIETEERYCEIAVERCAQDVLFGATA
jgi:site-specific DNA-methyltransferase (adenine-specific)